MRVLALLEQITSDGGRTPIREVVAQLGLTSATGRRLVALLVSQEYLIRVSHGHYVGGGKLRQLAAQVSPHARIVGAARPVLRRLAQAEQATAYLGVFEGEMVTYLVKEGEQTSFTREQNQLEAYCTGIGKVLLAQLEEERLAAYLAAPLVALTSRTITDPESLRAELAETRARGYAVDDREMANDLRCVAVAVPQLCGSAYAISLSSALPAFAVKRAQAVSDRLSQAAAKIASNLVV